MSLEDIPVNDLIALALTTSPDDEDSYGEGYRAISTLQRQGTREVFEACLALVKSSDPHSRTVSVDILGQLGWPESYPFSQETLPILFNLIENETDPDVLHSVGSAIGHLHDDIAIRPLLKLKSHPDVMVRFGVVMGLLAFDEKDAIEALIDLSCDSSAAIRDWATFGLGSQIQRDTPEIREALVARLSDEDETTRGEAMVGLARRKDPRVFEPVMAEISRMTSENIDWILPLEAAEELADPHLLPALLAYRDSWESEKNWIYSHLEDAITACTPASGASDES